MVRERNNSTEVYFWVKGDQSQEVVMTLEEFLVGCKEPPAAVEASGQAVQAVATGSTPDPWGWMNPLLPKEDKI